MKTLTTGIRVKSTNLNCTHRITNVTDKKVCYTPEVANHYGYKANKNVIKIYTTSLRIANKFIEDGVWIIL